MKKCKESFLNLLCIIGIISLTGCAIIQPKDFVANNNKVGKLLPGLEPLIDLNSCGIAYHQKSVCVPNTLCSPQQNLYYYNENDASLVFLNDVRKNILEDSISRNGSIVFKIKDNKSKSGLGWGVLAYFTCMGSCILGVPIGYYKSDIQIEVDIRNKKNEVISTYDGRGKYKSNHGLYYGYGTPSEGMRKCNIEAVKLAMNEVKRKISTNYNSITLSLQKCINEIEQEQNFSATQSTLEPIEFLNGNEKYNEKDYSAAIKFYNTVLETYPYHKYALMNRGNALINSNNYASAINDFTRLIELDSKYAEAYYYRGLANENNSEYFGAISDFNRAIALNPDMAQAYLARGLAEDNLGITFYDQPYLYYVINSLISTSKGMQSCYMAIHNVSTFDKEAITDYQKALKINPDLAFAKERLSVVQNRIEQQNNLQEQQRAEILNNSIATLSSSLKSLSNSLNKTASSSNTSINSESSKKDNSINSYLGSEANKIVEQANKSSDYYYNDYRKRAEKEEADSEYYKNHGDNVKAANCLIRAKEYREKAEIYKPK